MLPHMENLYAMETSELKDLLEVISAQYGEDFLLQAAQQQKYAKDNIEYNQRGPRNAKQNQGQY